ncbi:MAG: hypothetical protein OEP95_15865 [Myxococcales bacterium]|nr:hypothetical protein [Myxococcales bacterium]
MAHDDDPRWDRPPVPPTPEKPPKPGSRADRPEVEEDPAEWDQARRRRRERKERVLHTRISEQLSEDIRRVADDLRVPVSNLVRNVLEETFGAVERVSEEVGDLLDEVLGGAEEASADLRQAYRNYERRRDRRREREEREVRREEPRRSEARPAPAPPREAPVGRDRFADVLGWQSLRINQGGACAGCSRDLGAGEEAFLGVTERGVGRTWLCPRCMSEHGERT